MPSVLVPIRRQYPNAPPSPLPSFLLSSSNHHTVNHSTTTTQSNPLPLPSHSHPPHSHSRPHSRSPSSSPSQSGVGRDLRPLQQEQHYFANGIWQHPSATRESRYSDFIPCKYDEGALVIKLYNYARTLLARSSSILLSNPPFAVNLRNRNPRQKDKGKKSDNFEMITSTPSPTLHASTSSNSHNGPSTYRFFPATVSTSPHPTIKTPAAAAFPRQSTHSPASKPHNRRPWSTSSNIHPSAVATHQQARLTVDAGTQYSPPILPGIESPPSPVIVQPPSSLGKRRDMSISPKIPPEPALEPQMVFKRTTSTDPSHQQPASSSQPTATSSSITLAKTSSSAASSSSHGSSSKRSRQAKPAVKEMPEQYETCDVKDLVVLISNMLMELVRFNDAIPLKDGRLTRFHSRAPPAISIKDYLQRLTTHATLSPPILLSMVYYIDRLCALYPAFTISSLTVHRFLITSATVASKGLSDSFWTNNTYARVGGVRLKELALLELEFLWRVEWRIVPKPEVLVDYYRSLVERSEGYKIAEPVNRDSHSTSSSRAMSEGSSAGDVGGGEVRVAGATGSDTSITMVDSQVEDLSISQTSTVADVVSSSSPA